MSALDWKDTEIKFGGKRLKTHYNLSDNLVTVAERYQNSVARYFAR